MFCSTHIRSLTDREFADICACIPPGRREPYRLAREKSYTFFSPPITGLWKFQHEWKSAQRLLQERRRWEENPVRGRLPNFLVLGAPRCATTWLHQCLSRHPDIFVAEQKEPEFFSRFRRFQLGVNWYRHLFAGWKQEKKVGEVSVDYFHHPEAPKRIHETIKDPNLKLIVLLREPIDRALSYYQLRLQKGLAPATFEKALKCPSMKLIEHGHYVRYYHSYLKFFSKDQIGIFLFEDVQKDSRHVLQEICRFLGVDPSFYDHYEGKRVNVSYAVRSIAFSKVLHWVGCCTQFFLPYWKIGEHIQNGIQSFSRRWNRKKGTIPLSTETRSKLEREYASDNASLAKEAGIDVSEWTYS